MAYSKSRAVLALSMSALVALGCTANPYTETRRHAVPENGVVPLGVAKRIAQDLRNDYRDKIVAEDERVRTLGAGLIGLGAALVGAAIGDAHKDAFRFGALGAATAYSLGNWNADGNRRHIYEEGMTALECAEDAVGTFVISRQKQAEIQKEGDALVKSIEDVGREIAAVETFIAAASGGDTGLVNAARSDVTTARALKEQATAVAARAQDLELQLGRVGAQLASTVNRIDTAVIKATGSTIAQLQSAWKGAVKDLAASADSFFPGASVATDLAARMAGQTPATDGTSGTRQSTTPQVKQAEDTLRASLGRLKAASQLLETRKNLVDQRLANINPPEVKKGMDKCGVQYTPVVKVQPASVSFTEKVAGERRITVLTGTKPFDVSIEPPDSAITIKPRDRADSSFWIAATDKVAPGTPYSVTVTDDNGRSAKVTITVQAVKKDDQGGGDSTTTPQAVNTPERTAAPTGAGAARTRDDVMVVQRALCVRPVTGNYLNRTRLAVQVFQSESGAAADEKLTPEQFETIKRTKGDCAPDRRNSFERSLGTSQINELLKKLNLPENGKLDDGKWESPKASPVRAHIMSLPLPESFTKEPRNAVALRAKAEGQLTQRLVSHLMQPGG